MDLDGENGNDALGETPMAALVPCQHDPTRNDAAVVPARS
jgi:hypothetical protein